jgi:hypothetical protein
MTSHFWKLMLRVRVATSSAESMNMSSHQGFLMTWELMIPHQWVVPTLIPLQVHSSLAFPRSSTTFDPTMLKRQNFRNPQRLSWGYIPV